jgi:hypothetical protein
MEANTLEVLKMLATIADNESDRILQRFNYMLISSTGLAGAFSWLNEQQGRLRPMSLGWLMLFLGIMGALLAVAWLLSMILGRFYEKRWFLDMDEIIKNDPELKSLIRARSSEGARIVRPNISNVLVLYCLIPSGFLLFWLGVCFVSARLLFEADCRQLYMPG